MVPKGIFRVKKPLFHKNYKCLYYVARSNPLGYCTFQGIITPMLVGMTLISPATTL